MIQRCYEPTDLPSVVMLGVTLGLSVLFLIDIRCPVLGSLTSSSSFFLSEFSSCLLHFSLESTVVFAGRSRETYSLEISDPKNIAVFLTLLVTLHSLKEKIN